MSDGGLWLLDTSIVLHLVRGKATGEALDRTFGLRDRLERPLISIVTVGELLAFARRRGWGSAKVWSISGASPSWTGTPRSTRSW